MNLQLRPWQMKDAANLVAICNNKKIWDSIRDLMPHPYTRSDAIDFLGMAMAKKPLENFCIEADGAVVGNIGLVRFSDIYRKKLEIGYVVGEKYWGRGYATEAVRLMLDYAWKQFDVVKIFASVYESNRASMKVLENNGFSLEAVHKKGVYKNEKYLDEYIFSVFRPGFLSAGQSIQQNDK